MKKERKELTLEEKENLVKRCLTDLEPSLLLNKTFAKSFKQISNRSKNTTRFIGFSNDNVRWDARIDKYGRCIFLKLLFSLSMAYEPLQGGRMDFGMRYRSRRHASYLKLYCGKDIGVNEKAQYDTFKNTTIKNVDEDTRKRNILEKSAAICLELNKLSHDTFRFSINPTSYMDPIENDFIISIKGVTEDQAREIVKTLNVII